MLLYLLKLVLRYVKRHAQWQDIHRVRRGFAKVTRWNHGDKKCIYRPEIIAGISSEWIIPPGAADNKVLLFFHGGGYNTGTIGTHRGLVSKIAIAAQTKALLIEYRLAPEHLYPAALEDAVTVYKWLIAEKHFPDHIAFGGDSAGGGLAVGTLLYLRDNNLPQPACAIALSPWLDLSLSGQSFTSEHTSEPMLVAEAFPSWVKNYMGTADTKTPYASPVFGDTRGLCPVYIQVGTDELLLDDSVRFAAKAEAQGTPVKLEIYNSYFHVFQAFYRLLPGSRKAIVQLGDFIKQHIQ